MVSITPDGTVRFTRSSVYLCNFAATVGQLTGLFGEPDIPEQLTWMITVPQPDDSCVPVFVHPSDPASTARDGRIMWQLSGQHGTAFAPVLAVIRSARHLVAV